jgi:RecB family endonuclease NucS
MQSIDILFDALHEEQRTINPIELKSVELPVSITNQVKRYVDWLDQYYKTNLICDIMPIVISKKPEKLNSEKYLKALKNLKNFNLEYSKICGEIKLIEFSIKNNEILFEINNYEE